MNTTSKVRDLPRLPADQGSNREPGFPEDPRPPIPRTRVLA